MLLIDTMKLMLSPLTAALTAVLVSLWFAGRGDSMATSYYTPEQRRKCAVLITGASRGIGKSTSVYLSSLGYTVFGSVRSQSSFDELMASNNNNNNNEQGTTKGKIIPVKFDVTEDKEIEVAVGTIEKACKENGWDFIGIVNNAGINPEGAILNRLHLEKAGKRPENILSDSETVSKTLDTNVVGCFRVTRAFMPILKKEKGRIVLIGSYFGSIAGAVGLYHLAYESSKFALEGLADGLRRGLKKEGIKVSLIKPGNIETDMNEVAGESSVDVVSRDVLTALEAKNPKARYYPGLVKGIYCKILCRFFALFPSWITDKQL